MYFIYLFVRSLAQQSRGPGFKSQGTKVQKFCTNVKDIGPYKIASLLPLIALKYRRPYLFSFIYIEQKQSNFDREL